MDLGNLRRDNEARGMVQLIVCHLRVALRELIDDIVVLVYPQVVEHQQADMQGRARRVAREEDPAVLERTGSSTEQLRRCGSLPKPVFREQTIITHPQLCAGSTGCGRGPELPGPGLVRSVDLRTVEPVGDPGAV